MDPNIIVILIHRLNLHIFNEPTNSRACCIGSISGSTSESDESAGSTC